MTKKDKIILFGNTNCPFTQKTIEFFENENLKFEFCDVKTSFLCKEEMIEVSGQYTTPVIKINDKIIIGFDIHKIKQLISIQ